IKILDPSLDIPLFLSKALEPPVPAAITNAVALLQDIGALDPHQSLTPLEAKGDCCKTCVGEFDGRVWGSFGVDCRV
ncbi:unnamed protein product, partial [Closterium sp. NIES-54]